LKRKKKKPTSLIVLAELREKMSLKKAYTLKRLAELCGKSVPAMRRYVIVLERLGFLISQKKGRIKFYCLPEAMSSDEREGMYKNY